jgi:transcription antitermination factor NusG
MNAMPDASAMREMQRLEDGSDQGWLIVITKGQRELSVRDRLAKQGFDVYVPMRLLDAVQAKRKGVAALPCFPRYVFARATLDAYRWQVIFSTIGVSRVLCDPRSPRGLRPAFIDRIRAQEIDGFLQIGLKDPANPAPPPPPKDPRKWRKLGDVVAGLMAEPVDERRGSVLVSLLDAGHSAITQRVRGK